MPESRHYSLIVIGGGITGLSSALAWAVNKDVKDFPVLVIEKEPSMGGYVTSFRRQGYSFDTVQIIPDPYDLLEYFGIEIDLIKFKGYYARIMICDTSSGKVKTINIPSGLEEFKNFMYSEYPGDKKNLSSFFSYTEGIFEELCHLKLEPDFFRIMKILVKCRKIIAQSGKTFKQLIDKFHFSNPEILEILDVFAAFSGLSSDRVASLLPVSAMLTSLNGSYRPGKGFIEFPLRMKQRLHELGAHTLNKSKVSRIITKNDRAIGVELEDGTIFTADHIVTTIDPKVALNELVDPGLIKKLSPSYARKSENAEMSPSALMINLGLDDKINLNDFGLNCGYNVLTTGRGVYSRLFNYYDRGELYLNRDEFFIPLICPSLPTGKKNALSMFVYPVSISDWKELREKDYREYTDRKNRIADFYIEQVEKYLIPGLKKHIVVRDIASPATFARYSGSPTGSKFDMTPYPGNFGKNRLAMRTPVKNLYQPKFSHGIWPCMQAGIQVVDMITNGSIMNGNARYEKKPA